MVPISTFICFYIMIISLLNFKLPFTNIVEYIGNCSLELYVVHMGCIHFIIHSNFIYSNNIIFSIIFLLVISITGTILLKIFLDKTYNLISILIKRLKIKKC